MIRNVFYTYKGINYIKWGFPDDKKLFKLENLKNTFIKAFFEHLRVFTGRCQG